MWSRQLPQEAGKVVTLSVFEEEEDRHLQEINDVFLGCETGLYELQRPLLSTSAAFKQRVGAGTNWLEERQAWVDVFFLFTCLHPP